MYVKQIHRTDGLPIYPSFWMVDQLPIGEKSGSQLKECSSMHRERRENQWKFWKNKIQWVDHHWGSENVLIGISNIVDAFKFWNFSSSLAICTSLGKKYSVKALVANLGTIPATMMPRRHSQNNPVPIMLKMALHENWGISKLSLRKVVFSLLQWARLSQGIKMHVTNSRICDHQQDLKLLKKDQQVREIGCTSNQVASKWSLWWWHILLLRQCNPIQMHVWSSSTETHPWPSECSLEWPQQGSTSLLGRIHRHRCVCMQDKGCRI